jgi:N-acetylglucosamine-6-phosphate deacetylase
MKQESNIDRRKIINANIVGYKSNLPERLQSIDIDRDGNILAINDSSNNNENSKITTLDIQGDYLSLGGIDLQINGCLGLAFPDLTEKDLPFLKQICDYLWQQGVDGFCPTIVTTSPAKIQQSLQVIDCYLKKKQQQETAQILGVHLEGPFLNYEKRGAHPAEYLLPLTLDNLQMVIGKYDRLIKIITIAPELDETDTIVPYLHSRGIIVSLGHSQATAKQAKKAFDLGATMVTHAFNAMPSLHHREAGLLGEAIIDSRVYCGAIADGQHVSQTMLKILLQASNFERGIFLVSDALAPIGLPNGKYPWDSREIEVKNGTARLPDGTLSGTTLPLLIGVENLINWGICTPGTAIALATEAPRKAIGIEGWTIGQKANLLRWHLDEINNRLTWQRI